MENTAKRKRKKRALRRGILITAGVLAFLALCYLVWTGLGAIPLKGEAENNSSAAEPLIPDLTPEPAAAPTPDIAPAGRTDSLYAASLYIDTKGRRAEGQVLIDYVSRQVETVYSLDIGLYPNAVAPGCMEVTDVALNGEMAYYTLDGPVLTLPLLNELDPGQSCRIYIRFSIDLTMGYGNGLDLICPLPLVAEDRDMLEEPGAPEYGAPAEYRVRLYGDTMLITETSFEQLEASTGYMFGAEKAVRFDVKVKRG